MSTVICDYCGTIYDPKNGPCPICGGEQSEKLENEAVESEQVSKEIPVIAAATSRPAPVEVPAEEPQEEPAEEEPEEEPVEELVEELAEEPVAELPEEEPEPEEELIEELPVEEPEEEPEEEPVPVRESMGDTRVVPTVPKAARAEEPAAPQEEKAVTPEPQPAESDRPLSYPAMPVFTEDLDITLEELDTPEETEERPLPRAMQPKKKKRSTKASRIVCSILAVLVVGFALYIGYRFAMPYIFPKAPVQETTVPTETVAPTTESSKECTGVLVEKNVSLTEAGQTLMLVVELTPADTEDQLTFTSDNPDVATVTADGMVTAVNAGRANITITCGNVMASCAVDCEFAPVPTEAPTTEPVPETRPANPTTHYLTFEDKIHLTGDVDEVTVSLSGDEMHLRLRDTNEKGKVLTVDWKVEDSSILEMDWNSIVPKAVGDTMITGEYGGEEYHCLVHVVE